MILSLHRTEVGADHTIGRLEVDGTFECYTLEDVVRAEKVYGETAIPAGDYEVILNLSPRFKRVLPRLLEVPGFTGILIHKGNGPEDTKGCILVGDEIKEGRIVGGTSTPAFNRLFSKLVGATMRGEGIHISITNEFMGN